MFEKKQPEVSASRFCRRAVELPYRSLYRHPEFTFAVSKISTYIDVPRRDLTPGGVNDPVAHGVVHSEANVMHDGSTEPLLPVEITFRHGGREDGPLGHGTLNRAGMSADATYFLQVAIRDPDGLVSQAFERAMQNAVLSGNQFMHLRCVRRLDHGWDKKPSVEWRDDTREEREFLRAVDRGEVEIGSFTFEKLSVHNELTTRAPSWSWTWRELEFEKPGLQAPSTAKWRRSWLPHRS